MLAYRLVDAAAVGGCQISAHDDLRRSHRAAALYVLCHLHGCHDDRMPAWEHVSQPLLSYKEQKVCEETSFYRDSVKELVFLSE